MNLWLMLGGLTECILESNDGGDTRVSCEFTNVANLLNQNELLYRYAYQHDVNSIFRNFDWILRFCQKKLMLW